MSGQPVAADRKARYVDWTREVATEDGRHRFLQEIRDCGGNLVEYAKERSLPSERIAAFLVEHAELNEQAKEALVWYTNQLAADVVEIADELIDEDITLDRRQVLRAAAKFRTEARKWLTSRWNRPRYGEAVQVEHTGATVLALTFGRFDGQPAAPALVGQSSAVPSTPAAPEDENWV
jgi:hypothetical protein